MGMPKLFKNRMLCSYVAMWVIYAFCLQSIFIPQSAYASKKDVAENCLATKSLVQSVSNDLYTNMLLGSAYNLIKQNLINDDSVDFNMNSLNTDKFSVTDIESDTKTVTIVFEDISNAKEISYVFAKDDFLKAKDINALLESDNSISVVKTKSADKTVSIKKTQSRKTFLGSLFKNVNKSLLVGILLFFASFVPADAQDFDTTVTDHTRVEIEFATELNGIMYDLGADLFLEQNKKYTSYPGFYSDQRKSAENYAENAPYTLAGINYNIHATIYRPLTLVDGTTSSFYNEVMRVAEEYKVSPYLLFMHAVTERMDLKAYEGTFDALSSTASKGSFQIGKSSLFRHLRRVYELDSVERDREYPFTKNYETFEAFEDAFEIDEVLALDNDDNYNPLEIELAASFVKMHFTDMKKNFPEVFDDEFLQMPLTRAPQTEASTADRNRMTLWSLSYTADILKYETREMFRIFDLMHDKDLGVYNWSRLSWRIYEYVEALDRLNGYVSFEYDSFDSISEAETAQAQMAEHKLAVYLYYGREIILAGLRMLMSWQGVLGLLAFVASITVLLKKTKKWRRRMKAKRHAYMAKIKQRPSVKYINKLGSQFEDSFVDFANRVFEDKEEREARKRKTITQNASLSNQKVVKRKHGERIKLAKGQMGVLYNSLKERDAEAFVLEQKSKEESFYQFLLRISDVYIETMVEKYPALGSDDFSADDILRGITIRLRDMEGTEGARKVQEIRNFIDANSLYVPITSVLEFFESNEKFAKFSDPLYDNATSRVKQAA